MQKPRRFGSPCRGCWPLPSFFWGTPQSRRAIRKSVTATERVSAQHNFGRFAGGRLFRPFRSSFQPKPRFGQRVTPLPGVCPSRLPRSLEFLQQTGYRSLWILTHQVHAFAQERESITRAQVAPHQSGQGLEGGSVFGLQVNQVEKGFNQGCKNRGLVGGRQGSEDQVPDVQDVRRRLLALPVESEEGGNGRGLMEAGSPDQVDGRNAFCKLRSSFRVAGAGSGQRPTLQEPFMHRGWQRLQLFICQSKVRFE